MINTNLHMKNQRPRVVEFLSLGHTERSSCPGIQALMCWFQRLGPLMWILLGHQAPCAGPDAILVVGP